MNCVLRSDLPGFYYDAEKNRYFPIKGPMPGSSRSSSSSSTALKPTKAIKPCTKTGVRTSKLLQAREIFSNIISSNKGKCNLRRNSEGHECPISSISEIGKVRQEFDYGIRCVPDCIWPTTEGNQAVYGRAPDRIWRYTRASLQMSSKISCIKIFGKTLPFPLEDGRGIQHASISILGSERYGGSLRVLNLIEPLDFDPTALFIRQRIQEVATFDCTIWTADCGTNKQPSTYCIRTRIGSTFFQFDSGPLFWNQSGCRFSRCGTWNGIMGFVQ